MRQLLDHNFKAQELQNIQNCFDFQALQGTMMLMIQSEIQYIPSLFSIVAFFFMFEVVISESMDLTVSSI